MGGCCCCASKGPEQNNATEYHYYARTSEELEHVPLSSIHATASSLSTGLLVDTNLETSNIDTYKSPPPPRPYNVDLRNLHSPRRAQEISDNTNSEAANTDPTGKCDELKDSDCKEHDFELDTEKNQDDKLNKSEKKSIDLSMEEEDGCPICLEEYDLENPKLTTKCEHHYHLACILEWMERSDTCPVCDQELIFSPSIDE